MSEITLSRSISIGIGIAHSGGGCWCGPGVGWVHADRRTVWFGRWSMSHADALTLAAAIEEAIAEEQERA